MAGLDENHILAVMRMRAMPIGGYDATNTAVIKWKGAKVLGQQDDRITLILI